MVEYARSVLVGQAISPAAMQSEIAQGLDYLREDLKEESINITFDVTEFRARRFYFYKQRHHELPEVMIRLVYPVDVGRWVLQYRGTQDGHLDWIPHE